MLVRSGKAPKLPEKLVKPKIVTGVQGLGRGNDRNRGRKREREDRPRRERSPRRGQQADVPMDDGSRRVDYHVPFDEELYMSLVGEAERFWRDHVKKDIEPKIDDYADRILSHNASY